MTRIAKTLSATALASLALCATAVAGGPALSAGYGCALACIERAFVKTTASSASIEVETSVPAAVTVVVRRADAKLGLANGPRPTHLSVPKFETLRTIVVPGLEPQTTYRVVVSARDRAGRVQTRSGTFTTRKVKVAVTRPDAGFSAGLGCKADCIEKGALTADATVPGRARLELRSSVPATFVIRLFATRSPNVLVDQRTITTDSRKTRYTRTLDGLLTGTRYGVTAWATDASGNTHVEHGEFRTRSAAAVVTFHKVTIITDSEDGANAGEIQLDFGVDGDYAGGMGFQKLDSGATVAVRTSGSNRPGLPVGVEIDGRLSLDLEARAVECDDILMTYCKTEGGWPGGTYGHAGTGYAHGFYTHVGTSTTFDLRDAFVPDSPFPPGGLPTGHDAYVVWETTEHSLRYRVHATVDVHVNG